MQVRSSTISNPNTPTTGWNMLEDVRGTVYVQRPHSSHPLPPPTTPLPISTSPSSFGLASSPLTFLSSSSSSSSSSSPTPPSPRSPLSSPRSPRSPTSSSLLGALSKLSQRFHSSPDLTQMQKNIILPKEAPTAPTTSTLSLSASTPLTSTNTITRVSSTPTVSTTAIMPTPTIPPTQTSAAATATAASASASATSTTSTSSPTPVKPTTPRPRPYSVNFSQSRLKLSDPDFLRHELQDKSMWTAEAMKEHPEILEIIERVRPLNRAASFGRLFDVSKTLVTTTTAHLHQPDDILGRDTLLQLIMQHLQFEGLKASRKILEEESNVKYVDYQLSESRLLMLMRLAIKDTERVWELTMAGGPTEETQKVIEEYLLDIGLIQDKESPDVNIWDDEPGVNVTYVDESSSPLLSVSQDLSPRRTETSTDEKPRQIKAASLNQLIIALTPEKLPDLEYLKTFLLTYQSFTTPAVLLQKLIERYHVPILEGMTEDEWRKVSLPIQARVGNVLRGWIRDHWSDFTPALVQSLKSFIDNSLRLDGNQTLVKTLTTTLNSKLRPEEEIAAALEEEKAKTFREPAPEPKVPKTIFSPTLSILEVDDEEIARQITLVDFELYASIKPSELLNQAWNKPKLKYRSPNLLRAINRFNEVSAWVSNTILRVERVKERARVMAKFIRIAEHALRQLNNFNTAMSILSGLNASSVHRLKYTKEEIGKAHIQTYNELQAVLSSNASYKEYRSVLSKTVPPCIPYLGVFLTDLTFIEEGNPYHSNGLINFAKRRLVYNVIAQIKSFQVAPYNLIPVYQIACLLWNPLRGDILSEEEQYKLSLLREPRNKDRSEIL